MSVCRICLETNIETNITVSEDDVNILERIIPPLNSTLVSLTAICETCSQNIAFASRFIRAVNTIEDRIHVEKKKLGSKVIDLKTFRSDKPSFTGEVSICRICLKFIRYPSIFLYHNNTNIMHHTIIRRMLEYCHIRLKYQFTEKPNMCTECWGTLQSLYTFKKSYLQVKQKVHSFCRLHSYSLRNIDEDTLVAVRKFFNTDLLEPLYEKRKIVQLQKKHWSTVADNILLLSLYYEFSDMGRLPPYRCATKIRDKWRELRSDTRYSSIWLLARKLKSMLSCNKDISNRAKDQIKAQVGAALGVRHRTTSRNDLHEKCHLDEGYTLSAETLHVKAEPSSDIEEEFLNLIEPVLEMKSECESSSSSESLPELERMDLQVAEESSEIDPLSHYSEVPPNITDPAPFREQEELLESDTCNTDRMSPVASPTQEVDRSVNAKNELSINRQSITSEAEHTVTVSDSATETQLPALSVEGASLAQDIHNVQDKRECLSLLMADHNYFIPNELDPRYEWLKKLNQMDKRRVHKCKRCEYGAVRRPTLVKHMLKLHGVVLDPLECSRCDYRATDRPSLTSHTAHAHANENKLYVCKKCKYRTRDKPEFANHTRRKHDLDAFPYECGACDFTAANRTLLRKHISNLHADPSILHWCKRCDFSTTAKGFLRHFSRAHMR